MDLKRTSRTVIINGVIAFAMGVLMMVWPGASAELVVRIFACWLAVIAITSLVFAPKGGRTGSLVTRAVLLILLGVLIFLTPMLFASMLTVLTGFAIIFFSFLALTVSFFIRRIGVRSWWVLTVIGVLGIVLGAFFLFAPQAGVTTLVFTLAGFIILVGIALVALGWRLRTAACRTSGAASASAAIAPTEILLTRRGLADSHGSATRRSALPTPAAGCPIRLHSHDRWIRVDCHSRFLGPCSPAPAHLPRLA